MKIERELQQKIIVCVDELCKSPTHMVSLERFNRAKTWFLAVSLMTDMNARVSGFLWECHRPVLLQWSGKGRALERAAHEVKSRLS